MSRKSVMDRIHDKAKELGVDIDDADDAHALTPLGWFSPRKDNMLKKIKYWLNVWSSPEGYTATDCSVLKLANAELAQENNRYRRALEEIAGNESGVNAERADGIAIAALAFENK